MARVLVLAIGLLLGCSGGPNKETTPSKGGGDTTARAKQPKAKPGKAPAGQLAAITFPTCGDSACVFHRGTKRYHSCLMPSDGKCAHFGKPCNPDGGCMFDPAKKRYRSCSSQVLGSCTSFGADCRPSASCQIDPKDGLYRQCQQPALGGCARFGSVCAPTARP